MSIYIYIYMYIDMYVCIYMYTHIIYTYTDVLYICIHITTGARVQYTRLGCFVVLPDEIRSMLGIRYSGCQVTQGVESDLRCYTWGCQNRARVL